ncbi:MAG TPA: cytochrome c biogenesis protein CcdA [Candidatus Acidoferrales bacterium]|nr:cytochrome c biogenesis protein CcdA [Candidatus Acidoferrales bacterium]
MTPANSTAMNAIPLGRAPEAPTTGGRRGVAALLVGAMMLMMLFGGGLVMIPRYRAAHPPTPLQQSDADRVHIDDIYIDLTLVTPEFMSSRHLERYINHDLKSVLPVLVGINTHRGDISHMHHLHGSFQIVGDDGTRYPSLEAPIVLSEHHDAYMILFPSRDGHGQPFLTQRRGRLVIEATDVGARPLRRFEWALPIASDATRLLRPHDFTSTLALSVALLSALLVVLSPCALELTLYYSAIISCTVADGERVALTSGGGDAARAGRRRLVANLASFVAGFTLLYAASGATVGLIGQGVRTPLGQYGTIVQAIGGMFIMMFALRVLGADQLMRNRGWLAPAATITAPTGWRSVVQLPRTVLGKLRATGMRRRAEHRTMRARDSFLVGLGLSTSCLTCMGGAVLYPLLVYAGITSWYTGLITLGLYSLAIAVPMVFIALGFFQIRMSLAAKMGFNRVLRRTSGVLLAAIAILIISGHERIMTDVTFSMLGAVARWIG